MNTSHSVEQTTLMVSNHFKDKHFATIVAPMQSGKTTTYLTIANSLIEQDIVEKVVIFSGNRERLLREQTEERAKHFKYVQVVWGQDLDDFVPDKFTPTLYIWDESHYGQSEDQVVDRFCVKCNICPAGVNEKKYVYLLSVSATPFSEVIDSDEMTNNKLVIFQQPSSNYYGISEMNKTDKIHSYSSLTSLLETNIPRLKQTGKIAIIRAREKGHNNLSEIQRLCVDMSISYKLFCSNTCNLENAISLGVPYSFSDEEMIQWIEAPTEPCVVIIKGKLMMGKTIMDKRNVAFCVESSKSPNADTLLQGLIGRFCGYNNPHDSLFQNKNTEFFLYKGNEYIANEYERYFRSKQPPKTGMNVVHNKKKFDPIYDFISFPIDNTDINQCHSMAIQIIKNYDHLKDRKLKDRKNVQPIGLPKKYIAGFTNELQPFYLFKGEVVKSIHPSSGINDEDIFVCPNGDKCYLYFVKEKIKLSTSTTTKKEIFCKPLQALLEESFVTIQFRESSFENKRSMYQDMDDIIGNTKYSNILKNEFNNVGGIELSNEIYNSLIKGSIYNHIKRKHSLSIKVGKFTQKRNSVIVHNISWYD